MLNITPTTAEAVTVQTADAFAAQAATRPPVVAETRGFGAGAFTCEGALAGSRSTEMPAALALPRIKSGFAVTSSTAISKGHAQAGAAGAGYRTSLVDTVQVDSVQRDANNFIQMALLYPVTPGGVGPHPAREPVPV
jgi:hypothetical protein